MRFLPCTLSSFLTTDFVQNSKSKRAYLLQMRAFLWFLPYFSL